MAQVGQHLLVGAVARGVLDVAQQRGDRRAQLVGGVGEQPALARARLLQRGEHAVEHAGEPADLIQRRRLGSRRVGSAVASISPAAAASVRSGRRPRRVSAAAASAASSATAAPVSATSTPRREVVWAMSEVSEATSTAPPAAGPLASAIGAA